MRIRQKLLLVTIEHDVTVGNVIDAKLQHQCFVSKNDTTGEIDIELDFCDINDVKFMGMPIEKGYTSYQKFKRTMSELGINVEQLMDQAASQIITDDQFEELKKLYINTVA